MNVMFKRNVNDRYRRYRKNVIKWSRSIHQLNYYSVTKITSYVWYIFRAALLVGMAYVLMYPILIMISHSVSLDSLGYTGMQARTVWIPDKIGLLNFKLALKILNYKDTIFATLKVSIISAILQLISSAVVGYGFARYHFKEKNILFACVLFTIIVPPQTLILPLYIKYRYFDMFGILKILGFFSDDVTTINLLNTPWSFWIPSLFGSGLRSGLFILIFKQFFISMPKDLENAAKIDGCGPYKTFLKIMLPNAGPAFLTVFLFSLVWHWNDFALSSILLQFRNIPISVYLNKVSTLYDAMNRIDFSSPYNLSSVMNAACLLTVAPMIIVYGFTQKYFVESIDRAGIKG